MTCRCVGVNYQSLRSLQFCPELGWALNRNSSVYWRSKSLVLYCFSVISWFGNLSWMTIDIYLQYVVDFQVLVEYMYKSFSQCESATNNWFCLYFIWKLQVNTLLETVRTVFSTPKGFMFPVKFSREDKMQMVSRKMENTFFSLEGCAHFWGNLGNVSLCAIFPDPSKMQ